MDSLKSTLKKPNNNGEVTDILSITHFPLPCQKPALPKTKTIQTVCWVTLVVLLATEIW